MEKKIRVKNKLKDEYLDPYERLANAIVMQAVWDYEHLKKGKKPSADFPATITFGELVEFFQSQWFYELTGVDGELVLDKLRGLR